jgi:antibiotic biosynthesis monooxygenase (ABM) superfamily enzyme
LIFAVQPKIASEPYKNSQGRIREYISAPASSILAFLDVEARMPEGGHWKPERVVVIEFPDMDSLYAWYNSPEYQPLIALRKSCTSDQDMLFVLEGA